MKKLCAVAVCALCMLFVVSSCDKDEAKPTTPVEQNGLNVVSTWVDPNAVVPESGGNSASDSGSGEVVISDPLTNGTSLGAAVGGNFTPAGYNFSSHWGTYVGYATGLTDKIRIEFDSVGMNSLEADGAGGKMVIFELYDAPLGLDWSGASPAWHTNAFFQFVKRGTYQGQVLHMTDGIRIKCGKGGWMTEYATYEGGHSHVGHPVSWDPNTVYHWVFELNDDYVTVKRNGELFFDIVCGGLSGSPLTFSVGTAGTSYSSVMGTYSNVKISSLE